MNYAASKNTIVPVSNDTPAQLAGFISLLQQRTKYNIPFFLMPVRLETRFRKVMRNLMDEVISPAVLNVATGLSAARTLSGTYGTFGGFTGATAVTAAGELNTSLSHIPALLPQINALSPAERYELQQQMSELNISMTAAKAQLQAVQLNDSQNTQMQQALDAINSTTFLINKFIQTTDTDNTWADSVSDDTRNTWNAVKDMVNTNQQTLDQMVASGNIDPGSFDTYINNTRGIQNYFGATIDNAQDKQYIWNVLHPLDAQFDTLNDVFMAAEDQGQDMSDYRASLNATGTTLGTAFGQTLMPGLAADRLQPVPGTDQFKPEAVDVSQQAVVAGDYLTTSVLNASDILNSLMAMQDWQDNYFNEYLNKLKDAGNYMAAQQPVTAPLDQAYLWQRIAPFNTQFEQLGAYINAAAQAGQDLILQRISTLDAATSLLADQWNTFVSAGSVSGTASASAGKSVVFSTWRLVDELWIRVYPDNITVDSLERALTTDERDAGIAYWTAWWAAHGDPDLQLAAWQALVALYGPERAAWIVKVMTPTNLLNVTIVSSVFPVFTHLSVMDTYTAQLRTLNSDQLTVSAGSFLDFYNPQLNFLAQTLDKVQALPTSYADKLTEKMQTASTNFAQLGDYIISQVGDTGGGGQPGGEDGGGGQQPGLTLQESIAGINGRFSALNQSVLSIQRVVTWEQLYSETPVFPTPTLKTTSWDKPSYANTLPDYFLFATINNQTDGSYSFRHIKIGNQIPVPLQTSLDPQFGTFSDTAAGHLVVDPGILWMTDFNEAVAKGMATIIRLTAAEATAGFDKLLVLGTNLQATNAGVNASTLPGISKTMLQDLLDSHHYTPGGMSFLRLGTPTNNTDDENSGYNQPDPYAELSFATEVKDALFTTSTNTLNKKDGQWLADALGIDYSYLQHTGNAGLSQISNAIAANRALWNGTAGNYMKEMMNFLFTDDNTDRTRDYFTDYVLGRGALPSLRIAEQPYGILPVSSFGRWEWPLKYPTGTAFPSGLTSGGTVGSHFMDDYKNNYPSGVGAQLPQFLEDRYHIRLSKVLEMLNQLWLEMAAWHVNTVNKNTGTLSAQQDFIELLSTDALMSEARNRFFLNGLSFSNSYKLGTQGTAPADFWTQILSDPNNVDMSSSFMQLFESFNSASFSPGAGAPNPLGDASGIFDINEFLAGGTGAPQMARIKNALRIFTVRFMSEKYSLYGPTVDEKPLTETDVLTANISSKNYIKWLRTSKPFDIWQSNNFSHMPSRSLLYLLLRQSVLLTYREAAWDILEGAGIFSKVARKIVGTPEGIVTQQANTNGQAIFTKWHPLFENINNLTGSTSHYLGAVVPLNGAFDFFYNYVGDITPPYKPAFVAPTWSGIKLADYLFSPGAALGTGYNDLNAIGGGSLTKITAMFNSLDLLQKCTVAELDRLVREHIDLCSYRLDAWTYGMVNKRLWQHRNTDGTNSQGARNTGIYLGAYGWLIDVRPDLAGLTAIKPSDVPSDLTEFGTLYYDQSNMGFIHAPSISHALTAAILRSGYVSENNAQDNRFAINLSSERVRTALELLEGVRNGQTLNALMGYQFERGLHEGYPTLELDKYIYVFRRKFPLVPPATDPSTVISAANNIRQANVVDGIELLKAFRTAAANYLNSYPKASIYEMYTVPGSYLVSGSPISSVAPYGIMDTADYSGFSSGPYFTQEMMAIITEVDRIANAVDALGDLTIAEGVYQAAKGNYDRSAAMLESLTEGKNPTAPQIIDTPRTGIHVNHRMAAIVEPVTGPSLTSPWTGISISTNPRANAEPNINSWLSKVLIGPFTGASIGTFPAGIGCTVRFNNISNVAQSITVTLDKLDIQPIDLLYMVQSDSYKTELTSRVIYYARQSSTAYYGSAAGIPAAIPVTVDFTAKGSAALASFQQILAIVSAAARVVNESKYLKPEDFVYTPNMGTSTTVTHYDTSELATRASDLLSKLYTLQTDLSTIPTLPGSPIMDSTGSNTTVTNARNYLKRAAAFGLSYAIPASAIDLFTATPNTAVEALVKDLQTAANKAFKDVSAKYTAANTIYISITGSMSEDDKVSKYISVITTILGNDFKVLPHFHFDYYTGLYTAITAQLSPATAANDIMSNFLPAANVALKMDEWLYGIARVQEKVSEIETIRMLADDTNDYALKTLRPVQFPYIVTSTTSGPVGDLWLGAEYPATFTPSGDKLSITVLNYDKLPASATATTPFCGLLVTEWSELIPFDEQTTGIAVHYEQPSAKPPQNILLAVNPQVVQTNDPHPNKTWRLEDLLHTMLDTMDMAKVRMLEPDHFKRLDGTEINDNRKNDPAHANPTWIEAGRSRMYEVFRWLLPAVTGEITPAKLTSGGAAVTPVPQYQSTDSIQQVSFDYNPNNADPPIVPGTTTAPGTLTGVSNWRVISSDDVLSNTGAVHFIEEQAMLTEIANTQAHMTAVSGV